MTWSSFSKLISEKAYRKDEYVQEKEKPASADTSPGAKSILQHASERETSDGTSRAASDQTGAISCRRSDKEFGRISKTAVPISN